MILTQLFSQNGLAKGGKTAAAKSSPLANVLFANPNTAKIAKSDKISILSNPKSTSEKKELFADKLARAIAAGLPTPQTLASDLKTAMSRPVEKKLSTPPFSQNNISKKTEPVSAVNAADKEKPALPSPIKSQTKTAAADILNSSKKIEKGNTKSAEIPKATPKTNDVKPIPAMPAPYVSNKVITESKISAAIEQPPVLQPKAAASVFKPELQTSQNSSAAPNKTIYNAFPQNQTAAGNFKQHHREQANTINIKQAFTEAAAKQSQNVFAKNSKDNTVLAYAEQSKTDFIDAPSEKIPAENPVKESQQQAAKGLSRQIAESITAAAGENQRQITIRLNPPELGRVVIKITDKNSHIEASAQAENRQTQNQLRQGFEEIAKTLAENGITFKCPEISIAETAGSNVNQPDWQFSQSYNNPAAGQFQNQQTPASSGRPQENSAKQINFIAEENFSKNYFSSKSVNMLA